MRKAGILLGAAILALALMEGLLRWMEAPALDYYRKVKLLHIYNPDYFVALPANEDLYIRHHDGLWEGRFTTNSLGMRGSPEPDPSAPKILCLGDSLVMGFGVSDDQTFCSRLGRESQDGAFDQKYQFMNIGVDAFGSMGSALRMEDMVPRLKNVSAVLFVISPNDFTMPPELAERGMEPDDVIDARRMNDEAYKLSFHIQFELTRYSYALQAAKLAYENLLIKRSITEESVRSEINEAGLSGKDAPNLAKTSQYLVGSFTGPVRDRCQLSKSKEKPLIQCPQPIPQGVQCMDGPPPADSLEPLPEFTQKAYTRMIAYAKANGFRLIPVILPMQVEEIFCHNQGKYHPLGNYALRASKYFEDRGVSVMQLQDDLDQMCTPRHGIRDFFIPKDGHLTDIGNQWATQSIAKRLPAFMKGNR
ncbi:MAG: lipase [Leptospiraceae bacterium]|nr:lipase [Leptospiraceae bacterium]